MKKKLPKIGDTYKKKTFIWVSPVITDDHYKVWFDYVYDEYTFKEAQRYGRWCRTSRLAKISNSHEFITN